MHVFQQLYCKIVNQHHLTHGLHTNLFLELQTTSFLWLFQLDDSKSLHKNWLFHHFHPLKNGCLGYQVGDDSASIFMDNPSIRSLSIEIFFYSENWSNTSYANPGWWLSGWHSAQAVDFLLAILQPPSSWHGCLETFQFSRSGGKQTTHLMAVRSNNGG